MLSLLLLCIRIEELVAVNVWESHLECLENHTECKMCCSNQSTDLLISIHDNRIGALHEKRHRFAEGLQCDEGGADVPSGPTLSIEVSSSRSKVGFWR